MNENVAPDSSSATESPQLYQAVRCGALRVAFPYGWAASIVEKFNVTPVPKAPAWLVGAANIDGRVFPVIDLSNYGAKSARPDRSYITHSGSNTNAKRLLIGGITSSNDDDRLAILFDGLPQQLGRSNNKTSDNYSGTSQTSSGITDGSIESSTGERFALVNINRLIARMSAELSTL
jgi:chemotaxis signal transduction protein